MAWISYTSGVVAVVTFPLRLVWKPVALFINSMLILISPLILMGSFIIGWCQGVLDFIASLQLACGACIGIVTGLTMSCTSQIITTVLGMHDRGYQGPPSTPAPSTPSSERPGTGKTEDSSSYETDWQLLNKPPPKRRRTRPGLWSQTIHEEDDDDSEI
ncbi:hypothetical protein CkaCkLH20_01489 [Colletotrichum karsti]|uniref:Uncharacterized protein n=1 Tax=Colletotrichum karsti TaxID=1095194 RepID=A0A9P6LMC0_9PEZI|nr:uncharacterized protein CkaCkLH20_01489 [Colletotrichum karsti]KAF9881339.1 hypothetical protein CkaCkLH20_01489 [Colletotrichum karsti]